MQFTIQIDVTAGKAVLTDLPDLAESSEGIVALAVTFDESWDALPQRSAVLWREGDAVLRVPLDETGNALLPSVFAASDKPFLLRITGEGDSKSLSTNEVCAKFRDLRSLDATEQQYPVYAGPYTLTQNGTYPARDVLFADDLTVNVPTVDTSSDTVTPETLFRGVTAHDASGTPITGDYVPPDTGFANLIMSKTVLDGFSYVKEN